jgi:pimeloyl-ACP methyl ester carboxylesterase
MPAYSPGVNRLRDRRLIIVLVAAGSLVAACASDPSTAPTTVATTTTAAPPATEPPETDVPGTDVAETPPETEPVTTATEPATNDTEPATTDTEPAPTTTEDPTAEAFQWSPVEGSVQTGFLDVPLDYGDPDGERISLFVARHRAADPEERIGVLFVNPGGPGFGGSFLAESAEFIYGTAILDHFDIIGWDPRGTGLSEPAIDCVDDYDPYFGIETGPDSEDEEEALREAAAEFAAGCAERSAELLNHITTVNAAQDIVTIADALGEDEISYFGWSYGTQLGGTLATIAPERMRAVVLDGAIDPTTGRVQGLVTQAAGFDRTLGLFLDDCAQDEDCPFHNDGDTVEAFEQLLADLEEEPIETEEGRPPLTDGVFELGVAQALYAEALWPDLAQALADAQAGDGSGILALYDDYYGRQPDGSYGNELEAYFAITCADDPPTAEGEDAVDEAVAARTFFENVSRVGFTQAYELVVCASFPTVDTEPFEITGEGAGPIMVVGNTGDPATPFEGSRVMAETLDEGFFVTVEANTHTAYGLNDCINDTIEAYLVELEIPDPDLVCS